MSRQAQPYVALAELLERELELVRARSLGDLAELHEAQARLRDALPATPPAAAAPELRRCRELQRRVEEELLSAREAILVALRRVNHAQRAAAGYKPMRTPMARVAARA